MDIDDLLERSAPPTTPRTPDLADELVALRLRAEGEVRGRRRPRRAAVVAGGLAAVLGLGGVATAAGWVPGIASFTSASGSSCEVEVRLDDGAAGGEPTPVFTPAERREALAAARASLAEIDVADIDRAAAIARWQVVEDRVIAAQPDPDERQPRLTGDDLEVTAVSYVVTERLRAGLASEGLDLRAVSVSTGWRCDR